MLTLSRAIPGKHYTEILNFFYFIINTNLFISLAAVFLTIETQIQLGMKPQLHPYIFIVFFATLLEYNIHRFVTVVTNPEALSSPKHKWVKQHLKLFYLLVVLSVIGFLIAVVLAKNTVLMTFIPIGILTLFYSLPFFKSRKNIFRLREIPFLKIFIISFVWSAVTVLLPIIQSGRSYPLQHVLAILAERFVFVFAITIPFDIRDIQADSGAGLKTIPIITGEKRALLLANISMFLFLVLVFFHYYRFTFVLIAFIISFISTLVFINNSRLKNLRYYHYFILDGTMLLQGLLVYLAWFLRQGF